MAESARSVRLRHTGGRLDAPTKLAGRVASAAPPRAQRASRRPRLQRAAGRATDLGTGFGGNAVLVERVAGEFGEPCERNPGVTALVSSLAGLVLTVDTSVL